MVKLTFQHGGGKSGFHELGHSGWDRSWVLASVQSLSLVWSQKQGTFSLVNSMSGGKGVSGSNQGCFWVRESAAWVAKRKLLSFLPTHLLEATLQPQGPFNMPRAPPSSVGGNKSVSLDLRNESTFSWSPCPRDRQEAKWMVLSQTRKSIHYRIYIYYIPLAFVFCL